MIICISISIIIYILLIMKYDLGILMAPYWEFFPILTGFYTIIFFIFLQKLFRFSQKSKIGYISNTMISKLGCYSYYIYLGQMIFFTLRL